MKLTTEEHARLLDKLDVVWKHPRLCPVCQNERVSPKWHIYDTLLTIGTLDGVYGTLFAHASCTNCGHTYFFHAVLLGIIDEPKPEETTD
jgi:predicted nucleic-acid-binding Zn-ribbon protein